MKGVFRFLRRAAIGIGLGGALTLIGFGFAIVGLALGTTDPVNPYEAIGFFASAACFALAGQWLRWIRYLVPGAEAFVARHKECTQGAEVAAIITQRPRQTDE